MSAIRKYIFMLTLLTLLVSACSPSASQSNDQVATAVAQTVQAQNSLTKIAQLPTLTPVPPSAETPIASTPEAAQPTNTTAPVVGAPSCTISARLAAENPPDGALFKPGETFYKTWSLENTGTCTWDKSYSLIFARGDLLGGLNSYSLPETVAPGETKNITILLKAPDTEGTFTGYWSIQTPWGAVFGVGPSSDPFYVQVAVSSAAKPKYGITSVTYKLIRDPDTGCPRNVWYRVYATITTNGPYEFQYYWDQSDGNNSGVQKMIFKTAGSQTIQREWKVGAGDSPNPRWMQIIVTDPDPAEYDRFVFQNNCP